MVIKNCETVSVFCSAASRAGGTKEYKLPYKFNIAGRAIAAIASLSAMAVNYAMDGTPIVPLEDQDKIFLTLYCRYPGGSWGEHVKDLPIVSITHEWQSNNYAAYNGGASRQLLEFAPGMEVDFSKSYIKFGTNAVGVGDYSISFLVYYN